MPTAISCKHRETIQNKFKVHAASVTITQEQYKEYHYLYLNHLSYTSPIHIISIHILRDFYSTQLPFYFIPLDVSASRIPICNTYVRKHFKSIHNRTLQTEIVVYSQNHNRASSCYSHIQLQILLHTARHRNLKHLNRSTAPLFSS